MPIPYSGILHCSGSSNDLQRLPLEEVTVQALIIDLSARVTLTQIYYNSSTKPTSRAKYVFPVPASAAICAFELHTSDGRTVVGVSKEKQVAAEEHERAMQENKVTALVEMVSDDLFTISVGSIPAKQTVKTKLVYVMTLMNNDLADEIRFFLPMYVAERYGPTPVTLQGAGTPSLRTKLRVHVDVQTSGRIRYISSPSHDSENHLTIEAYSTHVNRPSRRRYKVRFRSRTFLERDFILLVQAQGLDSPRCFAEMRGQENGSCSLAMQLTIVPKTVLPPIPSQEYIFLLDRSRSMIGDSIETAKKTLLLLLRLLPQDGTFFNLFGFGFKVISYWPKSYPYSQGVLESMSSHINTIQADLGPGTELLQALDSVFFSRLTNVPTAVFVLTDGQVYDIAAVVSLVQSKVLKSSISAPLKVFTLGIGEGVSTALCESVARAGKGVYLYAREPESILAKCARLLRAGRTPIVQDVTVDWGVSDTMLSSNSSVNFSDQFQSPSSVHLRPPPPIQQSPPEITSIHTGMRTDVYAILSLKSPQAPEYVVLRGRLNSDGSEFEHKVKIRGIELADSDHGTPLIHTIAAWKLIQNHQEGAAPLPQAFNSVTGEELLRKAAIVRLGTTYQLASQFTSFVAVDPSLPSRRRSQFLSNRPRTGLYNRRGSSSSRGHTDIPQHSNRPPFPVVPPSEQVPGSWPDTSEPLSAGREEEDVSSDYSTQTFTTLSSLISDWSDWSDSDSEMELPGRNDNMRSPSPTFETSRVTGANAKQVKGDTPVPVTPTVVIDLISLQMWDGSFKLNEELERLAGAAVKADALTLGVSNEVWATAIAVALMEKHLINNHELLDDLLAKAMDFLAKEPKFEAVLKRAKDIVL